MGYRMRGGRVGAMQKRYKTDSFISGIFLWGEPLPKSQENID